MGIGGGRSPPEAKLSNMTQIQSSECSQAQPNYLASVLWSQRQAAGTLGFSEKQILYLGNSERGRSVV